MNKICPKCKGIAAYNAYFKAHICLTHGCTWMEEPSYKKKSNKKIVVTKVNPKYSEVISVR